MNMVSHTQLVPRSLLPPDFCVVAIVGPKSQAFFHFSISHDLIDDRELTNPKFFLTDESRIPADHTQIKTARIQF